MISARRVRVEMSTYTAASVQTSAGRADMLRKCSVNVEAEGSTSCISIQGARAGPSASARPPSFYQEVVNGILRDLDCAAAGQQQAEDGAAPRRALHFDRPAEVIADPSNDRKSEPEPFRPVVGPEVALEKLRLVLGRDAGA